MERRDELISVYERLIAELMEMMLVELAERLALVRFLNVPEEQKLNMIRSIQETARSMERLRKTWEERRQPTREEVH